jgi:NitT/TauT family transport system substrate-binding protein
VIGYLPSNHDSALFVANAKGMFEKEGIKVQLVPFRTGNDIILAAKTNQIDIGYVGVSPATIAIDQEIPIKIVASVNEEGSGLVVEKNSNIHNISDLEGKTVAIPRNGSMQDILLKYELIKDNLSINGVKTVQEEVPLMPDKLHQGETDAYLAWEPYASAASLIKQDNVLMYSHDIWNNHPCCVIIAREDFIKKNPQLLQNFLKVHVEATDYVNTHKNETALILSQKLGTDIGVEVEAMKHVEFVAKPNDVFQSNVLKIVDIQRKVGYVKNNLNTGQIFDLRYLPN